MFRGNGLTGSRGKRADLQGGIGKRGSVGRVVESKEKREVATWERRHQTRGKGYQVSIRKQLGKGVQTRKASDQENQGAQNRFRKAQGEGS